jgi:hypothetical protein
MYSGYWRCDCTNVKNSVIGEEGRCLLTQTRPGIIPPRSAGVVTTCMLLCNWACIVGSYVRRFDSFSCLWQDSSIGRAIAKMCGFESHPDLTLGSSTAEHYTVTVEEEVHRFYKNGGQ